MNKLNDFKKEYKTPNVFVVDIEMHGVLCESDPLENPNPGSGHDW